MNKRLIAFSLLCSLFLGGTMPVYAETATVPSSATFNIDEPNPNTEFPLILGGGLVVELPAEMPLVEQDGDLVYQGKVGVRGELAPYAEVHVGVITTSTYTFTGDKEFEGAWGTLTNKKEFVALSYFGTEPYAEINSILHFDYTQTTQHTEGLEAYKITSPEHTGTCYPNCMCKRYYFETWTSPEASLGCNNVSNTVYKPFGIEVSTSEESLALMKSVGGTLSSDIEFYTEVSYAGFLEDSYQDYNMELINKNGYKYKPQVRIMHFENPISRYGDSLYVYDNYIDDFTNCIKGTDANGKNIIYPYIMVYTLAEPSTDWFVNAANTVNIITSDGVWVCEPDMTPVFYEN